MKIRPLRQYTSYLPPFILPSDPPKFFCIFIFIFQIVFILAVWQTVFVFGFSFYTGGLFFCFCKFFLSVLRGVVAVLCFLREAFVCVGGLTW